MEVLPPRAAPAELRLGSQLFINREDTPAMVQRFVRQMAAARLRVMRLFILWDQIEPRPGEWRWEVYDMAFATAAECGMGVVPTLMSVSPPGWMRCTGGPQEVGPLEDPAFLARSEDYVRRVVSRWADAPALDSWILWNEPDRAVPRNAATRRDFVAFLEQRYGGDIAAYNRDSYQQFETFEQILNAPVPDAAALSAFPSRAEQLNWARFAVADVTGHLRRIAALVRSLDPAHPVHLNPHRVSQCLLPTGQSLWAEGEIADFMGCSAHPVWHSTRFPRERWTQSIALFADLMRSCTRHPEELFWVTELQGGPTVFTGFEADGPRAPELRQWLWESIGAGARAVVYWCFNWRSDGYEAGEWGLLGQDGTPSERLAETTRVATTLEQHAELFRATRPPEPDVLILYSEASLLLNVVEGEGDAVANPRNRQMAADALCGAYLMAADLGREVMFISEEALQAHQWPATARVLLVPGCTALQSGTPAALTAFAHAGGTVIADHLLAWKTPEGAMNPGAVPVLRDLFGGVLADIHPTAGDFVFNSGAAGSIPGWFLQLVFRAESEANVLGRWTGGAPAAISTRAGAGRGLRIGTAFFQRYLSQPMVSAREFLAAQLPPSPALVHLAHPGGAVRLRRLRHPEGTLAVVLNRGTEDQVPLLFQSAGQLRPLDGAAHAVLPGAPVPVSVPAGEVGLFLFVARVPARAGAPSVPLPARAAVLPGAPLAANVS